MALTMALKLALMYNEVYKKDPYSLLLQGTAINTRAEQSYCMIHCLVEGI